MHKVERQNSIALAAQPRPPTAAAAWSVTLVLRDLPQVTQNPIRVEHANSRGYGGPWRMRQFRVG
jgi:hypothetical protein